MLVKDWATGEKADRSTLWQAPNKHYYTSEEVYNQLVEKEHQRTLCIDKMYTILGYDTSMKIPSNFFKKLKEWEPYGFDVVFNTMDSLENNFRWAADNKSFKTEISKVVYYCVMIENHLNDTLKQKQRNQVANKKIEQKIIVADVADIGCRKSGMDVSDLLGDL